MTIWDVQSIFWSHPDFEKGRNLLNGLLDLGYEPFAVVPYIFKGDLTGENIWLKKKYKRNTNSVPHRNTKRNGEVKNTSNIIL